MNKIGVLFFVFALFVLVFSSVGIHAVLEDVGDDINEKVGAIEDIDEIIETKWDYLGQEWQSIFLKNKVVSFLDNFFQKISLVFEILFGQPYSLSLTLFFIILLWFFFFLKFGEVLTDYSIFSSGISLLIGLGATIILAQSNLFFKIVQFFGWLIFSQQTVWVRWVIFWVIIFALAFAYKATSALGEAAKTKKEKMEKEEEKHNRGIIKTFANSISKALKKN